MTSYSKESFAILTVSDVFEAAVAFAETPLFVVVQLISKTKNNAMKSRFFIKI
jgi:hypothetical protein